MRAVDLSMTACVLARALLSARLKRTWFMSCGPAGSRDALGACNM